MSINKRSSYDYCQVESKLNSSNLVHARNEKTVASSSFCPGSIFIDVPATQTLGRDPSKFGHSVIRLYFNYIHKKSMGC